MLDELSQRSLAQLHAQGGPPFETLPIEALRAAMAALTATDSAGPAIDLVKNLTATLSHGAIPVRLSHPVREKILPVLIYFHGGGLLAPESGQRAIKFVADAFTRECA